MKLPSIVPFGGTKKVISAFGGYDRRPVIPDGAWRDMENMTSDALPAASPRPPRGTRGVAGAGAITGVFPALGEPAVCRGSSVVIGGTSVDIGLSAGEKTVVRMGAYALVFPDGKYINTADLTDHGSILTETRYVPGYHSGTVRVALCDEEGYEIAPTRSATAPSSPSVGDRWIDTSETPSSIKRYGGDSVGWEREPFRQRYYFRLLLPDIPYDPGEYVHMTATASDFSAGDARYPENMAQGRVKLFARSLQWFAVEGGGDVSFTANEFEITLRRRVPEMDFVTEAGNRLWGCKYGTVDGRLVNEIYASALGDFKKWDVLEGISTDSYSASVGSDGPFTGAATFRGNPVFFKEGTVHKVYGTEPETFRVLTSRCDGVAAGCGRSLCAVGDLLYYVSPVGVGAYDGTSSICVSRALGERLYDAVGGRYRDKYYVSARCSGGYRTFVYDTARKAWFCEDGVRARSFASVGADTYFYREGDTALTTVAGEGAPVAWFAESGDLGIGSAAKKTVRRLTVRMRLADGARASFFISRDGGEWEPIGSAAGPYDAYSFPLTPVRCGSYRFRIEGVGECRIFSVTETAQRGAER